MTKKKSKPTHTAEFTHTYRRPGRYFPKITVRDALGRITKASTEITVIPRNEAEILRENKMLRARINASSDVKTIEELLRRSEGLAEIAPDEFKDFAVEEYGKTADKAKKCIDALNMVIQKKRVGVSLAGPEPTVIIVKPQEEMKRKPITFKEIFPEIALVEPDTAKSIVNLLNIPERTIQNALRDALREKGATNMVERKSDSSLEIADLEDFTLKLKDIPISFCAVVKGYNSVSRAKISFEDVAHQIMKANDTNPDHILLVLAKPLTDGVVTRLVKYGKDCGNRNLAIIVDQINLARFLRIRGII